MPKSIPQLGDSNWGTPLNNHISQLQSPIDGSINKFEQFSQRPTNLTTDDQGKTYLYTQTGNLHQWIGTQWKVLNESVINVKDYGAVGDGVTDDTVAIRLAITKGSKVYIPAGTYLTETITFPSNYYPNVTPNSKPLELLGENMYNTILLQKVPNQTLINFVLDYTQYPCFGHILTDFSIKPNSNSNSGVAIDMTGCIKCRVDNILFINNQQGYFEDGVGLHTLSPNNIYITCHENYISNISANNSIGPVKLINIGKVGNNEDAPHLNHFDKISVISCNIAGGKMKYGIFANAGFNLSITNSHFEGIYGVGAFFGGFINSSYISSTYFEGLEKNVENSVGSEISIYNCFINEATIKSLDLKTPANLIGNYMNQANYQNGVIGSTGGIGTKILSVDYLNGGKDGGSALELSSNGVQSLIQFNQYYGNFNNTGATSRRARGGAAGQISFATYDIPSTNVKAGDLNFSVAETGLENQSIGYKTILSLNQKAMNLPSVLEFANNLAAIAGGLIIGDTYRTGEILKIVY